MNHNSLMKHYRIIKTMKELGDTTYNNDSEDIAQRMSYELLEKNGNRYTLFFTKSKNEWHLVRTNIEKNVGYTLVRFCTATKYYQTTRNNVGRMNNGFVFNGDCTDLDYIKPFTTNKLELPCLPLETSASIIRGELEELEFQYGTLYDFGEDVFDLYCIFSLLINMDEILDAPDGQSNFISFLQHIDDDVIDELCFNVEDLLSTMKVQLYVK